MTDSQPKPGLIPWPPLIYVIAIAASVVLGLLYPLPWIGDLLGDLMFAAGWVALFFVAALWFTAIRVMLRAKTTFNPNAVPDHLVDQLAEGGRLIAPVGAKGEEQSLVMLEKQPEGVAETSLMPVRATPIAAGIARSL